MSPFNILKFSFMLLICGVIYTGYDVAKHFMEEHQKAQQQLGADQITIKSLTSSLQKEKDARVQAEQQQEHAEAVADAVQQAAQVRAPVYMELHDYAKNVKPSEDGPTAPVLRNTIERLYTLDPVTVYPTTPAPVVGPEDRPPTQVVSGLAPTAGGHQPAKQRRWWDPRTWARSTP